MLLSFVIQLNISIGSSRIPNLLTFFRSIQNGEWPVRKENEVALQRAEMRMVRWMCGVKLQDRVPSKELRGRLELEK